MPMPVLDPARFYAAVLTDPSHTLPLPKDLGGRNFFAEGEVVDSAHPFYAHLLADGSLKRKPAEEPEIVVADGSTDHIDGEGTTTVLDHGSGILTSVDASGKMVAPDPATADAVIAATKAAGIDTPEATLRQPEPDDAPAKA